ncbi:hypothetical protein glysoja_030125, partial [Glycine soja]
DVAACSKSERVMDLDFHGMKRKRLQALCKKHGIPANLKNKEMADRLSSIFKGKEVEDPVGSGNVGTKKGTPRCVGGKDINAEMVDLVTPGPGLEERSVVSAKNLKGLEIERLEFEMNSSPEITRGDSGICGVEEDMKSGLNEEQVVNSQGNLHSEPLVVALEELNSPLVEEEVEKLGDKNNLLEGVCENGKGRDEAVEQGDHNSPQGSNMKDVNVLHVSQAESLYPMVEEDEAAEQGSLSSPQASKMKDVNVYVSQEESGYLMVEEYEAAKQGDHSSPQGSNMKDMNVLHVSHEESVYPLVEDDEAVEQGNQNSPQASNIKDVNVLLVSQEESCYTVVEDDEAEEQGSLKSPQTSNMKDVNVLHVSQEEPGYSVVEEDEAAEQGNHNSPQGSNMKDINVLRVTHEEFVYPMVEGDGNHNSPQASNMKDGNVLHVSPQEAGYPMVEEEEALEQGNRSSPQGSGMKDENVLHVTQEESLYPMVEEDEAAEQGSLSSPQASKMKDVNVLHVSQEESGYPMMEEYEAAKQGDHSSPQGSNMKDMNVLHVSHEESVYPMVEDDEAVEQGNQNSPQASNMKDLNVLLVSQEESGYSVVEENEAAEQGDQNSPQGSNMIDMNVLRATHEEFDYPMVEGDEASELGNHNSPQASNMKDANALHVSPEESGCHTVKEEAVGQGDHSNPQASNMKDVNVLHVSQEESGYPMVEEDEVAEQDNQDSTQASNMKDVNVLHVSPEESGYPMVEEVQKSEDNIYNGSVYNFQNSGSEVADGKTTLTADGKTNLTAEHFVDDVPSSLNKYLVGTPDLFQRTYPENEVKSSGLNIHQDTCEEELKIPQKTGLIADPGECIGFSPNHLEASAVKSFQAETYFLPSALEDVEGTCNMKERTESVKMEQVDDSQQVKHSASSVMLLSNEDLVQVASVEVGDNLLEEEVEKSGLLADSEECIGYMPNNLEPSATKGFQAETYFDSSTLGDVVETCNIEESIESDQMEKEYSQEVLNMANELQRSMEESDPMEGEVTRLFDNSDDHDDAGGTEAEDKSQHHIKTDMDSIEKYLLNDFQSIDDADGQNSDEKPDEYAPTVPQSVEMNSCTFSLQQISAPDTVSGDEGTFQEKLETPTKCTPILSSEDNAIFYPNVESSMKLIVKSVPVKRARDVLGASDMKENIKIAKKEQAGTIISRSAFPKRKPLQDLRQN